MVILSILGQRIALPSLSLIQTPTLLLLLLSLFYPSIPKLLRLRPSRPPLLALLALLPSLLAFLYSSLTLPNLFVRLPLNASAPVLAEVLVGKKGGGQLSEEEAGFLRRLNSFDVRLAYARWGEDAVRACGWCAPSSRSDHLLYLLPALLLPYTLTLLSLGLITHSQPTKRPYRRTLLLCTVALALLHLALLPTLELTPSRRPSQPILHNALLHASHLLLSFILLLTALLSAPPPPATPQSILAPLLSASARTHATLTHASHAQRASVRSGALRKRADTFWREEEERREAVERDGEVREVRERVRREREERERVLRGEE